MSKEHTMQQRAHPLIGQDRGFGAPGGPVRVNLPIPDQQDVSASTNGGPSGSTSGGPTIENPHDLVAIIIKRELQQMPTFWPDCCIYKVPERFHKGNEEFYKPRAVSLGPYHFDEWKYQHMEMYKLKYVEAFLSRYKLNVEYCLDFVRLCEEKARHYYAELIHLSSDEFVKMMLVDAIFVLELMLRHQLSEYIDDCDRIYQKPRMIDDVFHDILLIQNQIPFFVLEGLYELVGASSKENPESFFQLAHEFFKPYVKIDNFGADYLPLSQVDVDEVKHFVDFIRCYYLPPHREDKHENENMVTEIPPSVTTLDDAGVKFVTTSTTSLLDIQFNNGHLTIPNFRLDDWAETLFRNIIVFEQCHHHDVKYISEFMFLMGCLIKTTKDVDLLVDHEIICSMLGSNDDVSTIFNKICDGVGFTQSKYYYDVCKKLNAYCRSPWPKWKAILKRDYFNTPWKVVSTIAAIVLLMLTAIQTICSILQL